MSGYGIRLIWDWVVDTEGTVARIAAGNKYNFGIGDWDDGRWWRIQGEDGVSPYAEILDWPF